MTKKEFRQKKEALVAEMTNLEGAALEAKQRELNALIIEYQFENAEMQREQLTISNSRRELNEQLREFLRERKPGSTFEIKRTDPTAVAGTKMSDTVAVTPNNTVAILNKTFDDKVIYTTAGCPVQKAAAGISDWVYAGGVTVKIANELTPLGDAQKLDLSKLSAVQNRIAAKIIISNQSLENSDTDLIALTNVKIDAAYAEAINFAACSTAKYGANFYGGFAHANKQTASYTTFNMAKAMEMVGKVAEKNYEANYGVFVMGPADYYAFKATPVDAGSGLMMIDADGRLGGFPVFVSNAINRSTVKGTIAGHNIGFGLFNYLPCLQHGNIRLSIDSSSADAADVDGVIVTVNTDWSMTDLYPDAFVLATKSASQAG